MIYPKRPKVNSSLPKILRGVLLVNKPPGISSYDCIRKIKPLIPKVKVGHTGTLDPKAQGLLIILLGDATKIAQYLSADDKEYIAKIRLGLDTDTDDITGKIIRESACEHIDKEEVLRVINSLVGIKIQTPPRFSALKYKGERMYDLARKGIDFTPQARQIEINHIELLNVNLPYLTIKTTVSKGTYIRAIARDIGKLLGCGGCLAELTRIRIGKFKIEDAIDLESINYDLIEKAILPLNVALSHIPAVVVSDTIIAKALNGQPLDLTQINNGKLESHLIRIVDKQNQVLIMGKRKDKKVLPDRLIYADISY